MIDNDGRARGFPAFGAGRRAGRQFADSWWGNAWVAAMEDTALDPEQLRKGRKYARAGQVDTITVSPGRIAANVHDGDHYAPYHTVVLFAELSDAEWDRFLDRVASKAGHIAALLDGDMPHDLVAAADDAGVRLLPGIGDLEPDCDCPDWDHPCQHAAALSYQVSWLLDADPFVLLLIRGRAQDELMAQLRSRNTTPARSGQGETAPGTPVLAAYARDTPELPDVPTAVAGQPMALAPLLAQASADGIDPLALGLLAADAAARARELLAQHQVPAEVPDGPAELDAWTDAVRLAATFPDAPATARLAQASGRAADLPRAVAAWEYGGRIGLDTLETPWNPPKTAQARAQTAFDELVSDGLFDADTELTAWRNRWTVTGRGLQLRYGTDGRWYPYVEDSGHWHPAGPPTTDPVSALAELSRD